MDALPGMNPLRFDLNQLKQTVLSLQKGSKQTRAAGRR